MTSLRATFACAFAAALISLPASAEGEGQPIAASPELSASLPVGEGPAPLALDDAPDPLFDDDFEEQLENEVYDPFENPNRAILSFNQGVDKLLWSPLTTGYRFAVPEPARKALHRAFQNLNTPVYVVNHLLQLRPLAAAETLGAFVMNSAWGIGGLLDAADAVGLERRPADFGQTLARAGVGSGPYLMVPLFGPSTLRDGFGWVVDRAFHPATYFLGIPLQLIWRGGAGVTQRDAVADSLEALESSSLDFYAVLRSAYVQARENEIRDEEPEAAPADTLASSF